ncbi:MAG: hypothetical protein Q9212_004218 [Teloschistes hypoglaucus]
MRTKKLKDRSNDRSKGDRNVDDKLKYSIMALDSRILQGVTALQKEKEKQNTRITLLHRDPVALGVDYTESRQIIVPEGTIIEVILIQNTLKLNERDRNAKLLLKDCYKVRKLSVSDRAIPYHVYSLKVKITKSTGRRIDAVIVVEHRNVAGVITEHDYVLDLDSLL